MTDLPMHQRVRQTSRQIFMIPAVLAVLSAAGLVFALVGDGIWDGLSWLALSIPIVLIAICLARRRRRPATR
jgi:hypothetical protein